MRASGWAKGAAFVVAAMGTVAGNRLAELAGGGVPMKKAILEIVLAGTIALVAFLSTESGRAAVVAEAPAAAQAAVTTAVALLATPAGLAAVGQAQDAVAAPAAGGDR